MDLLQILLQEIADVVPNGTIYLLIFILGYFIFNIMYFIIQKDIGYNGKYI